MLRSFALGAFALLLGSNAYADTVTVTASPVSDFGLDIFAKLTPNTMAPVGSFSRVVDGITWDFTGTGEIFNGSFVGVAAQPAGTNENYMAVQRGGSETITFSKPLTEFQMVYGSVDATGVVDIDGSMFTGTGLASVGVIANGSQTSPFSNIELSFSSGMIDSVTLSSPFQNSLEFIPVAAPEPSTWAMMLMGFVGLGFFGVRKAKLAVI